MTSSETPTLGFIGLGQMGAPMAEQMVQEARGAGYGKKAPVSALQIHERLAGVEVTGPT